MTRHSRSPANVSMRYVECGAPFDLPHEAYTGGSRTPAAAAASLMDTDDGRWNWRGSTASSSDAWGQQPNWSQPEDWQHTWSQPADSHRLDQ